MKTAAAVVFHSALLAFSAWGGMQGRMVLNGDGWLRFSERGELATCPPESDARWKRTSVPEVVERWGAADEAWYRRRIDVPASWKNRRIVLSFGAIQIAAKIHVDGKYAGDVVYPGGEVDLTHILSPGTHEIEIRCIARVSSGNDVHYMDFDRKITTPSVIAFRWITGDVILRAMPKGERIEDVQVITSVRDRTITFDCETANLYPGKSYCLAARVRHVDGLDTKRFSFAPARTHKRHVSVKGRRMDPPHEANSAPDWDFDEPEDVLSFTAKWDKPLLWDVDSPQNIYAATLTLQDEAGNELDTLPPVHFGFREFSQKGRDFFLNGRKIHLRAQIYGGPGREDGRCAYEHASGVFRRLKEQGRNFVIESVYAMKPGQKSYDEDYLRAADDEGMLLSVTTPHHQQFWPVWEQKNRDEFRRMAKFVIRRVRNHPAVVMWAMNHNACGYNGDQNPLKFDGREDHVAPPTHPWWVQRPSGRTAAKMMHGFVTQFDRTRIAYHHAAGMLDGMHTVNIYLDWTPRQERGDWLEEWSKTGTTPLFFVEWGPPSVLNWPSWRGPHGGDKTFATLWGREYAAEYLGDRAFEVTPAIRELLERERRLSDLHGTNAVKIVGGAGGLSFAKASLHAQEVMAYFLDTSLRDLRAAGISGILPWEQNQAFRERPGVDDPGCVASDPNGLYSRKCRWGDVPPLRAARAFPNRSSPNCDIHEGDTDRRYVHTPVWDSYARWFQPVCAWISGQPGDETSKDHVYRAGETVSKTLTILNDTRDDAEFRWAWRCTNDVVVGSAKGSGTMRIPVGEKARIPISFVAAKSGDAAIEARVKGGGALLFDTFQFRVMPDSMVRQSPSILLYDPKGMTAREFGRLGIVHQLVNDISGVTERDLLVIGRESLTTNGLPGAKGLPKSLRMVVFEQTREVLQNLLGFRVQERGMRNWFVRVGDHPIVKGFDDSDFTDWRGEATLVEPYLPGLPYCEASDPRVEWCGFMNTRPWRCRNRGNVSSVMIEKPQKGDFLSLLDGGFALQYSPLLEFREGGRSVVFCQLDVTGRTRSDLVADAIMRRLVAPDSYIVPKTPGELLLARSTGVVVTNFATFIKGRLPKELRGLSNADWDWHGACVYDAVNPGEGTDALGIERLKNGARVSVQVPPEKLDVKAFQGFRISRRAAHRLVNRLRANLGLPVAPAPVFERLSAPVPKAWLKSYYFDNDLIFEDDPYRYMRW